jgi:hypothetical protein
MPEATLLIVMIVMLALKAAAIIGLVFFGVRLAIREPVFSHDSLKRLRRHIARLTAAVTRSRQYHGLR